MTEQKGTDQEYQESETGEIHSEPIEVAITNKDTIIATPYDDAIDPMHTDLLVTQEEISDESEERYS